MNNCLRYSLVPKQKLHKYTERWGKLVLHQPCFQKQERQPYQHHTRIPEQVGIYVYSFALNPEQHQPSGTVNMSRIDNATLLLNLNSAMTNAGPAKLRVYAVNYNVLRIMAGMGGLAYSN